MLDERAVADLFPGHVAVAVAGVQADATLLPGEERALGRAADVRRREYGAGRGCARRALIELGRPVTELLRDEEGLPTWPAGVVGGITHSRDLAAAVVGDAGAWTSLALDVETRAGLEPHLWEKTLTTTERSDLPADDPERAALALFCAKEALYKAWYPVRRVFLGFHDVELVRDGARVRIAAFVKGEIPPIGIALLDGPGASLAAAWWPADASSGDRP